MSRPHVHVDRNRRNPATQRSRRMVACLGIVALAAVPMACGDDDGTGGSTETTEVAPSTVTTGVPNSSTTVPVPTSDAGADPGLGTQAPQPGGTAEPNTTPGPTAG